ncbi:MAG: hypothetical protein IJ068_00120 [Bacilli bacterium]|nr:hypothetical protein [Bacilli bacterium]
MSWLFGDSSDKKSVDAKNEIKTRYGNCCALCENLDINNMMAGGWFSSTKYKCYKGWCTLTERNSCVKEISADPNYGRDFTKVYEMITGRKYYILTAICEILGISMDNRLFTEIKALIELVRDDESTIREAIGYDSFGPEIADMLRTDRERVELCNYLLNEYIIKVYSLIGLKNLDEAIKVYENMVRFLFFRYKNVDNYAEIIQAKRFENPKLMVK